MSDDWHPVTPIDQTLTWCSINYPERAGTGARRLREALREIIAHSEQGRKNRVYHRYL